MILNHNQNINKNELDQYYTNKDIALYCFNLFNQITKKQFDLYLEPSAGSGSFSDLDKNFLAFDLSPFPNKTNILKADFLSLDVSPYTKQNKIGTIGNPPFGKKGNLAIQFLNKSLLFSEYVGFILPLQFCKWSVQSKINPNAKLIFEEKLPENSFHTPEGKNYKIRCVFQIWTLKEFESFENLKDLRLKNKPQTEHPDFKLYQYNRTEEALKFFDYEWDFAVYRQGFLDYNKKFFNKNECNPKQQYIFIKAKNEEILNKLLNIDFHSLSLKNSNTPGFGKADLIQEYIKKYEQ